MADPIQMQGLRPLGTPLPTTSPARAPATESAGAGGFHDLLVQSLDRVNQLQQEADLGVQKLMTGETENVAEVFTAARKAGVAFDLLMEIRNKLMEAYTELQQMRV